MSLNSRVVHYPYYPFDQFLSGSEGELKFEDGMLTLTTEGVPVAPIVVKDINKVLFSIPINELDGYSHFHYNSILHLNVKGKRYHLDFISNVSVATGIMNNFTRNRGKGTGIYEWLELLDDYGVKKKFNYWSVIAISSIGLLYVLSRFL